MYSRNKLAARPAVEGLWRMSQSLDDPWRRVFHTRCLLVSFAKHTPDDDDDSCRTTPECCCCCWFQAGFQKCSFLCEANRKPSGSHLFVFMLCSLFPHKHTHTLVQVQGVTSKRIYSKVVCSKICSCLINIFFCWNVTFLAEISQLDVINHYQKITTNIPSKTPCKSIRKRTHARTQTKHIHRQTILFA